MKTLSPTIAKSLETILNYEDDNFEATFGINFDITRERFDQVVVVELIPNGSNIPVTKENKKQYVQAYIDFIFNVSVEPAFDAFSKGFHHVCGSKVLVSTEINSIFLRVF
jgi:E3 ubiquitin-protein ligase HERC4